MMSHHLARPEVTRKWRYYAGSHLEVAEGRQLGCCLRLGSYRAVTHRRWQSRNWKLRHVTWLDLKWRHFTGSQLEVAVEGRKLGFCVPLSSYRAELAEVAVTWQEMMSHDPTQSELTRKWHHLTGSHLEVCVEGKNGGFVYVWAPTRL